MPLDEIPNPDSHSISTGNISAENVNIAGRDVNIYNLPKPEKPPLQRSPRAEHFTGREKELEKLLADLQPGVVVTLCGPGGIGKTALAAEALWTLSAGESPPERFPDGVIFHTFYHQPQADLALEAIAMAYGEAARPTAQIAAQRALAGKRALLVLDGAEACDDLPAVLAVRDHCGVLVTTRSAGDALDNRQDLAPLPKGKAVSLLRAWAGKHADDLKTAEEICILVGRLPLAVRLVGRYLSQTQEEAPAYLAWLKNTPLQALDLGKRQSDSVPLLLERSLTQVSLMAYQVLGVAGILALAPFGRQPVATALKHKAGELGKALGELVNYGLLRRDEGYYQASHSLVHTYARERCTVTPESVACLAEYYAALAAEQCQQGLPGYARLDQERPHILSVQKRCVESGAQEAVRRLVWAVEEYFDLRGYWTDRITLIQNGLDVVQTPETQSDRIEFLNCLGLTWSDLGETRKAIECYTQALDLTRQVGDRRGEGIVLGNLGSSWFDLGEARKAIEVYEQALAIAWEIGDKSREGIHLGNLGNVWSSLSEMRKAIEYYEKALGSVRETGSESSAGPVDGENIARLGRKQQSTPDQLGALDLAWSALGEARKFVRSELGRKAIVTQIGDWRSENTWVANLDNLRKDRGETRKAIRYSEQALAIARQIGDRRNESAWLGNLGNAWRNLGEARKAIEYFEQALAIAREMNDRRNEGIHLGSLGIVWRTLGKTQKAKEYYEQALAIAIEIGDRRNEDVCLGNLGNAWLDLGDMQKAIEYYNQALEIDRQVGDRRGEGSWLANLGLAYQKLGDIPQAKALWQQALAILQGIEDPRAQTVKGWLDDQKV